MNENFNTFTVKTNHDQDDTAEVGKINSQFHSARKDLMVIAYDSLLLHEYLCVL